MLLLHTRWALKLTLHHPSQQVLHRQVMRGPSQAPLLHGGM